MVVVFSILFPISQVEPESPSLSRTWEGVEVGVLTNLVTRLRAFRFEVWLVVKFSGFFYFKYLNQEIS